MRKLFTQQYNCSAGERQEYGETKDERRRTNRQRLLIPRLSSLVVSLVVVAICEGVLYDNVVS